MNTLSRRSWALRSFSIVIVGVILAVGFAVYVARWQARVQFEANAKAAAVAAAERERVTEAASKASLVPLCTFLVSEKNLWTDYKPPTKAGQGFRLDTIESLDKLYNLFHCETPPK